MTVKILTDAQKKAVGLLYSHKRKNTKELAAALNVSERTIQRVLEEVLNTSTTTTVVEPTDEAKKVMALLYKHKMSYQGLERLLSLPSRQTSPVSSELSMAVVQAFLCKCTKEELATLFYVSGLAKLMDVINTAKANQAQPSVPVTTTMQATPTSPIPKSAQKSFDLGVKQ